MSYLRQRDIFDQFGYGDGSGMGYDPYGEEPSPDQQPYDPYGMEEANQPDPYSNSQVPPMLREIGEGSDPRNDSFGVRAPQVPQSPRPGLDFQENNFATDRFNKFIDQFPEQGRPSLARSIVAAGMGFSGSAKPGMEYMEMPHQRDVADWKAKAEPYYQSANLERQNNINNRTLAYQTRQADAVDARNRITEEKNVRDAEIAKIRADAYAYKQAGWIIDTKGPNVIATDPHGSGSKILGPTGHLSDADKITLETAGRVEVTKQQGANSLAVAQQQGVNQQGAVNTRQDAHLQDKDGNQYFYNGTTNALTPLSGSPPYKPGTQLFEVGRPGGSGGPGGGAAGGHTNMLEQMRIEQDKMQDVFQQDANARKFITKDSNGRYTLSNRPVVSPGGFFSRAVTQQDVDMWDALKKYIDPSYNPPPQTNTTPTPQQAPPQVPPRPTTAMPPQPNGPAPPPSLAAVPPARPGQVVSADDRARAAIRGQMNQPNPGRQAELEGMLNSPNTPNQIKPAIQRELDDLKKQKATDFLRSNGLPVTPANIQHAIESGRVQ